MLSLLTTAFVAYAGAPILQEKKFIEIVYSREKATFIDFFAPWCSHCKKMEHDWDALADVYNAGDKITIAKVDCTGTAKALCADFQVKSYPTLRYFDPQTPKIGTEYRGKRRFMDLKQFVEDHIVSVCSAITMRGCDEEQMALITQAEAMERETIEKQVADFVAESDALTAEHESATKAFETKKLLLENRRALLTQILYKRGDPVLEANRKFKDDL